MELEKKTTTISILTGLFPPTSGMAMVGGFNITTEMDLVHRVMSVCPQFDTLWGDLTSREHLLFYARLKGVPSNEIDENVSTTLRSIGLEVFETRKVIELSGGMRRRLSLGIALVGNPRIIFLDEPTTGLDPESRRHLWDVLLKVKEGRCIILTTHSMEEADILCTRIGIMSKGSLRCVGSNLHLKNKYGQGFTIKFNISGYKEDTAQSLISSILPTATLIEAIGGSLTYQVARKDLIVSKLFATMMLTSENSGILDWGISQTTLEDVFLNIVKNDESEDKK